MILRTAAAFLALAFTLWADDVFRYQVYLEKLPRQEKGELVIDQVAISYRSENGKRTIQIPLGDVIVHLAESLSRNCRKSTAIYKGPDYGDQFIAAGFRCRAEFTDVIPVVNVYVYDPPSENRRGETRT